VIAEPTNPDDLLAFIRDWFRLLAADRWAEASAVLDEPNQYGIEWTPEYIRYALDLAFGPGCRFRVAHPEGPQFSDPDTATGRLHADVLAFDDGRGGWHNRRRNFGWHALKARATCARGT
jgi:hypothetical protein